MNQAQCSARHCSSRDFPLVGTGEFLPACKAKASAADEALQIVPASGRSHRALAAAQRIAPSLEYMLQHLQEPLPVSTLSRIACVSNSHFFALFKLATGVSPLQFLIQARLRHACSLLQQTPLLVKEVAASAGYQDGFYFSRAFKSAYHSAPSHYRTHQQAPELAKDVPKKAPLPGD